MMSQTQLVAELLEYGYRISGRQIRDWRKKGLLPPLISRSRGRGLGIQRYWGDNETILAQAIAVADLLGREGRTKWVPLRLWFAGFEVNLGSVRALWLESLDTSQMKWLGSANSKEECEDAIGRLCTRLARVLSDQRWAKNAQLPWTRLEPLLVEVFNACVNPHEDVEIAIDDDLAETVEKLIYQNRADQELSEFVSKAELLKWLDFIRSNLSVPAMRRIIAAATDDELRMAQNRWKTVCELLESFAANASGGTLSDDMRVLGRRTLFEIGGLCILGFLLLHRNGKGHLIESILQDAWVHHG